MALWSGLVIRDFHQSGQHDLATYAVNANLDTALSLLAVIPVVCLALGALASRTTAGRNRPDETKSPGPAIPAERP